MSFGSEHRVLRNDGQGCEVLQPRKDLRRLLWCRGRTAIERELLEVLESRQKLQALVIEVAFQVDDQEIWITQRCKYKELPEEFAI